MREVRGGERRDGGSCVPRKEKAESKEAGNKDRHSISRGFVLLSQLRPEQHLV